MTRDEQETGPSGVVVGFVLGAVVGAAVALLFAPATGEDTRRTVNRRTREGRDRMIEALRQGRGILSQQRETIVTAFDRARQQAQRSTPDREPEA